METPITRHEFEAQTKMLQRILDILEGWDSPAELLRKAVWDDYDVMTYLRISLSTLKRHRKDKSIPSFRAGRSYRYVPSEIIPLKNKKFIAVTAATIVN